MCNMHHSPPSHDDQSKPRLTLIPAANPLPEIVPDTFQTMAQAMAGSLRLGCPIST